MKSRDPKYGDTADFTFVSADSAFNIFYKFKEFIEQNISGIGKFIHNKKIKQNVFWFFCKDY